MAHVRHVDDAEVAAEALRDVPLDPVIDTVLLSVLDRSRNDPAAFPERRWWFAEDETGIVGVAFETPPWPLGLGLAPGPWLDDLARTLLEDGWAGIDVQANKARAEAFAVSWTSLTGQEWSAVESMRLLRCLGLTPPVGVEGLGRLLEVAERDLLVRWIEAFTDELGLISHDAEQQADWVLGRAWLWLDPDGQPVSLAIHGRAQHGVARIGPVYTPPEHRRHGYAAAVTATATQAAYDAGAEQVVLYTDAANPTSNAVYERIGYVYESDSVHLRREVTIL